MSEHQAIYFLLTCTQMSYAFKTSNDVISYGNPHERIRWLMEKIFEVRMFGDIYSWEIALLICRDLFDITESCDGYFIIKIRCLICSVVNKYSNSFICNSVWVLFSVPAGYKEQATQIVGFSKSYQVTVRLSPGLRWYYSEALRSEKSFYQPWQIFSVFHLANCMVGAIFCGKGNSRFRYWVDKSTIILLFCLKNSKTS